MRRGTPHFRAGVRNKYQGSLRRSARSCACDKTAEILRVRAAPPVDGERRRGSRSQVIVKVAQRSFKPALDARRARSRRQLVEFRGRQRESASGSSSFSPILRALLRCRKCRHARKRARMDARETVSLVWRRRLRSKVSHSRQVGACDPAELRVEHRHTALLPHDNTQATGRARRVVSPVNQRSVDTAQRDVQRTPVYSFDSALSLDQPQVFSRGERKVFDFGV